MQGCGHSLAAHRPEFQGNMTKLRISGVSCDYGAFKAVQNFSLDIAAGEFVSLLGPSGCGKTTMLRMIAGFVPPTSGTIELNGKVISSPGNVLPPEQRGMSMIFQSYAIWPNMTVFQNVAFGLELRKVPASELHRRVTDMLEIVQLSAQAQRYPAELSGGQQQRVALARAVVVQPEVLLLDEPLSNLDANLREEMRLEIRRMHEEFKITTVYVTHDQAEAMVASDRIVVMRGGHIEQVDPPNQIYRAPATKFVASFIGRTNFLTGRRHDATYQFGPFDMAADQLPEHVRGRDALVVSVRPHNIRIIAANDHSPRPGMLQVQGEIVERAYFGDHWDYTVSVDGGIRLTVNAEANPDRRVGDAVLLQIDPDQVSAIASEGAAAA
jgi:ABC-type Fe3+/spermidine/putrescine transport system ATPase subunit